MSYYLEREVEYLMRIRLNKLAIPLFLVVLLMAGTTWALATSAPTIKAFAPAASSVLTNTQVNISFEISDLEGIANSNYYIKLDGTTIPTTFEYTSGYTEYIPDG